MSTAPSAPLHTLRSREPATEYTDAYPIGNGIRAAMCEGRIGGERLHLNDTTAWSGFAGRDPLDGALDRGPGALAAVRAAIARGDIAEAERLIQRQQGTWAQAYLPLGWLDVVVDSDADEDVAATDYVRTLSLRTGIARHEYVRHGAAIVHESWADAVTGAIVHRVTADRPVRLRARIGSLLEPASDPVPSGDSATLTTRWLLPIDVAPGHERVDAPVRYDAARGRIGSISVTSAAPAQVTGGELRTAAASAHLLQIDTGTTPDLPGVPGVPARVERLADAVALRRAHVVAHAALYDRCSLELPSAPGADDLDTAERIRRAEARDDPGLAAIAFHYGRYLLLSSSRPGGLPANLQGIWNAELPGPWSSAYTANINLQAAYWPAEVTDLAECHVPLLRFLERMPDGQASVVARELYGAGGWVLHHNSDAWGYAAPVGAGHGDPAWSAWPMGGVWLATHAWEHFAFGGDLAALREAWPAIVGAARFAHDWIEMDADGRAHSAPSTSPENTFVTPDGSVRSVTSDTTMDVALLRELSRVCTAAAGALGIDDDTARCLAERVAALPDATITARGTVQEWDIDRPEAEPRHRHLSHLVGLFPFAQISPNGTPALAAAAAVSIVDRGDETSGWALAWRSAMWARLRDGDQVHDQIRRGLRVAEGAEGAHRGGVYRNLFAAHPPFQLDGNFGMTAAIAEALVQSQGDTLDLLPALPSQWPNGRVRGLRARGGWRVQLEWSEGEMVSARVTATRDGEVTVRLPDGSRHPLSLGAGESADLVPVGASVAAEAS